MRYIYKLIDPISMEIRYIGQTNDLYRRYNDHLSSSLNNNSDTYNTYKSRWIRKLISDGYKPIIEIIEECDNLEISNLRERYHIYKSSMDGCKLTNSYISDVTEYSIETRRKMSESKLGKSLIDIHGEEKAKELSNNFSKRVANYRLLPKSDESKIKISNTLKEYFSNKENHWAYGLKMSDEHNEKLRQAKLNNPKNVGNRKPRTEEQKEKIRNSIKGTKIKRSEIIQYDFDMNIVKEWKSFREIERFDNTLRRNQISSCCKGMKESYAGFIWMYKKSLV